MRIREAIAIVLLCTVALQAYADPSETSAFKSISTYLSGPDGYQMLSDAHRIAGYTAAALGLSASILNPALVDDDLHGGLGTAAAVTSAITIGLGLVNYGDRISFEGDDLLSQDMLHALLSVSGSLLMIAASLGEDSGIHPWLGGIGAGLMSTSILIQIL
ncbi:MAG: hypothetical protein K9M84_13610 [Spirochaetia bacterium]|nr:hypothetical protein [Spirochaetia bacterium]